MMRCVELINDNADVDFVDINSGCPIHLVYKKVQVKTFGAFGGGVAWTRKGKKSHWADVLSYESDMMICFSPL